MELQENANQKEPLKPDEKEVDVGIDMQKNEIIIVFRDYYMEHGYRLPDEEAVKLAESIIYCHQILNSNKTVQ